MNQQTKDGICQSIGKIHNDTRIKMKERIEVKFQETTPAVTTKCCYTCGEEGHISSNCTRKRERFPTYVVEYEDHELEDLLALEKPKRKKNCNNSKEKDISQVLCYNCKEKGHYAKECPEKNNRKDNEKGNGSKEKLRKDLSLVTCFNCKKEGHYMNGCPERKLQNTKRNVVITRKRGPKAKVTTKEETTPKNALEGTRDMSKVFCHHCRRIGHFTDDCPN